LVGKVLTDLGNNHYLLEVRNKLNVGDEVEVIQPKGDPIKINFPEMQNNKNGESIESANPNTIIKIKTDLNLNEKDMIRKKVIKE
jgi:putative protease